MPREPLATGSIRSNWTLILALVLISINLRPLLTGLGPVVDSIRASLQLSGTAIGLLITLPVLCFGAFAPFAPRLLRFASAERIILIAMIVLIAGIALRSLFGVTGLVAGTLLGGASISVIMVLVPAIIKKRFPAQAGNMMGLYSTALCIGAAVSAGFTVPLENLFGDWRWALAFWLIPVVVTIPFWLPHIPRNGRSAEEQQQKKLPRLFKNKLAWQVTLLMGLQSSIAYCVFGWLPVILIDRGLTALTAGFVLSLSVVMQLVTSPTAPWLATRGKDQRLVLMCMLALTAFGLMALLYAPLSWVWVATVVLGLGMGGTFSIALALLVLRAPNAQIAASLSGMVQGVGYTIAALAPLLTGLLYELTNNWNAVGVLFTLLLLGSAYFGYFAAQARLVQAE